MSGFMKLFTRDSVLVLTCFAILSAVTILIHYGTYGEYIQYEYGELGHTAAAWIHGKGISNVFNWQIDTGPTAWCQIGYVSFYASVFLLLGTKTIQAYWFLLIFRCVLLAASFAIMLRLKSWEPSFKVFLLMIFLVYGLIVVDYHVYDLALNIFLSTLVIYHLYKLVQKSESGLMSYVLGIVLPLCNISLAIGYFLFYIWFLFRKNVSFKRALIPPALIVITFFCWGLRNQYVMGKFIPYKSNMWFEFYMSNVKFTDGILGRSDLIKYHPLTNKEAFNSYKEKGEIDFIKDYEEGSKEFIFNEPEKYLGHVMRRSINATLFLTDHNDRLEADKNLINDKDYEKLSAANLIVDGVWVGNDIEEKELEAILVSLNISDTEAILEFVDRGKQEVTARKYFLDTPKGIIRSLLISTLPTILILLSLTFREVYRSPLFIVVILMYILSLAPYILLSHYSRYQLLQIGFFILVAALFSEALYARILSAKHKYMVNG